MPDRTWERYEDAARALITQLQHELGLGKVDNKKGRYNGQRVKWQIDVAGYELNTQKLVLFECKLRSRKIHREQVTHFRCVIEDLGAEQGFIISDKGITKDAKKLADSYGIKVLPLFWNRDTGDYLFTILSRTFVKITVTFAMRVTATATVVAADTQGNVIGRHP